MSCVAIIGAGGHAKVVLDALLASGVERGDLRVTAASVSPGQALGGIAVLAPEFADGITGCAVHVAIGDNAARLWLVEEAAARGHALYTVVHPAALVAASARVEPGCLIAGLAIVAPDAQVGRATIVNHAAVVDHDCIVGEAVHIAPGAVLGGNVRVDDRAFVGANATVLPGRSVGAGARVGAGAVVTRDVGPGITVAGSPARILGRDEDRRDG